MTRGERDTLRGLIHLAWPHRHDPERARRHAALIVEWWEFGRYAGRLRRRQKELDDLVELLRRTDPASVSHDRKGVARDAA